MIEVEHLTKRYGVRSAVEDVSFKVGKGEIVGFLGPNGAGKSTTLRILTGFLAPSGGAIRIDGIDALSAPIEAKRRIGYMPEASPLYPEMRVREYLRYRAELKGVARKKISERVERSLEQASVADAGDRIIGQLSKGMRQRVGLADALVADPPILVLDEPTAGLDPNQIRQVRDLVRGLAGTKTILVSTHILPEVESTCDRVVIIHRGRIVREGTTRELRAAIAGGVLVVEGRAPEGNGEPVAVFRAVLESIEGVRAVESVEPLGGRLVRSRLSVSSPEDVGERVFAAFVEAGLVLRALRPEGASSLEDVFSRLTMDEQLPGGAATIDGEHEGEHEDEDEEEDDEPTSRAGSEEP
ncbi:MAG: ABC transporter ATP-binding protein [Myxococcota bacterium]|nr:ABC transporter ATP-binding protein [Myxococcota bacterium]